MGFPKRTMNRRDDDSIDPVTTGSRIDNTVKAGQMYISVVGRLEELMALYKHAARSTQHAARSTERARFGCHFSYHSWL
jgi:hypothetical protein